MLFLDVEFILSLIVLLLPLHYYVCISALSQGSDLLNGDDPASPAVDDVSHAFVQTDSELHYFRDISHREILLSSITELGERFDSKKPARNMVLFETEFTDFESSSIGVPVSKKIFVLNPTNSKVVFTAITSQAINFHCSFLEKRYLSQNKNFIRCAFPTDQRGNSSGSCYSSQLCGQVFAQVLKVVEVFSSDANVQVELPGVGSFSRSAHSYLWEIAPYETKSIANVNVLGNVERNSTSFVYINMRLKDRGLEIESEQLSSNLSLVIPLEVQVSKKRGIFSTDSSLQFGLIKEGERSKQLTFRVYSNLEKGVDIETIYVSKSINKVHGVYMQFATKPPISLKCGARNQPGSV
uniref:TMEM131 second Ig-like domain-containing protein n=1 Tax=Ditylenchus dipsaci TaxID=166011 RepID=A0A915DE29_9BILA